MTNAQREIIRQAVGSLGAAIVQSLPSDDHLIMGRVREAHASLRTLFFVPTEEEMESGTERARRLGEYLDDTPDDERADDTPKRERTQAEDWR